MLPEHAAMRLLRDLAIESELECCAETLYCAEKEQADILQDRYEGDLARHTAEHLFCLARMESEMAGSRWRYLNRLLMDERESDKAVD